MSKALGHFNGVKSGKEILQGKINEYWTWL
jgi:hypothetical protein